ncbi:hypothetical protein BE04_18080 [Sorangium cellulosum]|uniref:Uncharacterized protein n=1 Tax=Sorangium cellulosum TaxID=56 RepID=A0A150PCQ3_SORCE|nr:hypothetical protein BE04_18080 [Sorangium cellulosum]
MPHRDPVSIPVEDHYIHVLTFAGNMNFRIGIMQGKRCFVADPALEFPGMAQEAEFALVDGKRGFEGLPKCS